MGALLLTILGAVGLVGLGIFISSEIQRKQGKTDAQISSRDNNQGFVIVVVVIFVIYFVALMIKGDS
jgi:ABC-type phosphate/phosphonate transport system permease subunit